MLNSAAACSSAQITPATNTVKTSRINWNMFFRAFRDHQMTQSVLIEKLVTGKLGKQQFIDQDGAIAKKKDECTEKESQG